MAGGRDNLNEQMPLPRGKWKQECFLQGPELQPHAPVTERGGQKDLRTAASTQWGLSRP